MESNGYQASADGDIDSISGKVEGSPPPTRKRSPSTKSEGAKSAFSVGGRSSTSKIYAVDETRKVKHGLTNTGALINMIKGLVGTGVLSMGAGFANSGNWLGIPLTVFLIWVCVLCMHALLEVGHYYCATTSETFMDYADVAEAAFLYGPVKLRRLSRVARHTVNVLQFMTQLGFCCAYVAFISQNIQQVVSYHIEETISIYVYIAAFLLPVLCLAMIRELKFIAPLAFVSNLLFLASFVIIFQHLFTDLPSISDRSAAKISTLPLFFGTVMFSFEAINLILPMENKMKTASVMTSWNGVLNTASVICCCLYICVGFYGYLKYGEAAATKGTISLNLPNDMLYQAVRIMVALAMFITYALQFYVPVNIIRNWLNVKYPRQKKKAIMYEYIGRAGMVILTFALAAVVPHVDLFVSLIGSFTCSALGLIIPAILDILSKVGDRADHFGRNLGPYKYVLILDLVSIFVGLVGLVTGTYSSIVGIADTFINSDNET